jgi:hypothetical protein
MNGSIDFETINRAALSALPAVLARIVRSRAHPIDHVGEVTPNQIKRGGGSPQIVKCEFDAGVAVPILVVKDAKQHRDVELRIPTV